MGFGFLTFAGATNFYPRTPFVAMKTLPLPKITLGVVDLSENLVKFRTVWSGVHLTKGLRWLAFHQLLTQNSSFDEIMNFTIRYFLLAIKKNFVWMTTLDFAKKCVHFFLLRSQKLCCSFSWAFWEAQRIACVVACCNWFEPNKTWMFSRNLLWWYFLWTWPGPFWELSLSLNKWFASLQWCLRLQGWAWMKYLT